MKLFHKRRPNTLLYLMPIRLDGDQLPRGKIRMLCCNTDGELNTAIIDKSDYEVARRNARKMEHSYQDYATLGMEIGQGKLVPLTVAVEEEELWALEHIIEHSLKKGLVPDVLKKYPKKIISLGEVKRAEITTRYERKERRSDTTPGVLNRLPYYPEEDIEISIPIYKAEHRYPLIVLKQFSPDEQTPSDLQRLLILDSDGDLAIIRVHLEPFDKAHQALLKWKKRSGNDGCIIYSQDSDGISTGRMSVSPLQRKALDAITGFFEENGYSKQPVPADINSLISQARKTIASQSVSIVN